MLATVRRSAGRRR